MRSMHKILIPFRYMLAVIRVILLIVPMAIFILSYLLASKILFRHTNEKAFALRRIYLRYCNYVLGIRTRKTGSIYKETALYVSNHRSLSDPLILCQFIDAFIIAKAEVARYPLISTGANLTGILYVQRNDKDSRAAVRDMMKKTLKKSQNVLVYPEGTVNAKNHVLPYRPGTFREIAKLGIPVVPVCLEYKKEKDIWHNRGLFKHFFLQFGYLLTLTRLHIGEPMLIDDGEKLCEEVERWTNERIKILHSDWKGSVFNPE